MSKKSSGSVVKLYVRMAEQPWQVDFEAWFHGWKKKTIQLFLITASPGVKDTEPDITWNPHRSSQSNKFYQKSTIEY
jgi:hypothetical protein